MNNNAALVYIFGMILIAIILSTGDPDIIDSVIAILQKKATGE